MKAYPSELKDRAIKLRKEGKSINVPITSIARWTKSIIANAIHPLYKTAAIQHDYFSQQNITLHPERLVLVGFIAADGCISHRKSKHKYYNSLCLNLAKADKCVLDILNQEIASGTRIISSILCTESCMLSFPSEEICSDLSRYGIVPRKTHTFQLPQLTVPEMRYFLRGYFYGDGNVYEDVRHNRRVYSLVGNFEFANQFKTFMEANGVEYVGVYPCSTGLAYQIRMPGKHGQAFESFIFNDDKMILLDRKHKKREQQAPCLLPTTELPIVRL